MIPAPAAFDIPSLEEYYGGQPPGRNPSPSALCASSSTPSRFPGADSTSFCSLPARNRCGARPILAWISPRLLAGARPRPVRGGLAGGRAAARRPRGLGETAHMESPRALLDVELRVSSPALTLWSPACTCD